MVVRVAKRKGAEFIRCTIDANNALSQGFFRSVGFGPFTVVYQKALRDEN